MNGMVAAIGKVTDLVAEIASAGNEQAQGIAQVSLGLEQIDQAVQGNTATAEESAAAAEELSSQAEQLREMLQCFRLRQGLQSLPSAGVKQPAMRSVGWTETQRLAEPMKNLPAQVSLDDSDFGKY